MKLVEWVIPFLVGYITVLPKSLASGQNNDFKPKVNKIKTQSSFKITAFDDSTTLLRIDNGKLVLSKDNGIKWDSIEDINKNGDEISWIDIDPFNNRNRAYALVKDKIEYYLTDDMGATWRHLKIDTPPKKQPLSCDLKTHPFKAEYMSISCILCPTSDHDAADDWHHYMDISKCESFVSVSKDAGKTFNQIILPENDNQITHDDDKIVSQFISTTCEFAKINEDSTLSLSDSAIICNKMEQFMRVDSDAHQHSNSGDTVGDIFENMMNPIVTNFVSKLYYTDDFGKNVKQIEKFKDMTVNSFNILKSYLVVITQDDIHDQFSPKRVWISKDGTNFNQAYIPSQIRHHLVDFIYEDDLSRIILPVSRSNNNNHKKNTKDGKQKHKVEKSVSEVFISDSTGIKFTLLEGISGKGHGTTDYQTIDFLKGTSLMTKMFSYMERKEGNGNNYKFHSKQITKITTDNGKTWNFLKIVDPGNEDKYPCNIADVEKCHLTPFLFSDFELDPTPGILIMIGSMSSGSSSDFVKQSTFLSRDGGISWRQIFDFPTATATGDYGNIIIAVPFDPNQDNDPVSEFYYSLDQGFSWQEYELEETMTPMEVLTVTRDGSGYNFIISGMGLGRNDKPHTSFESNLVYAVDFSDAFNGKDCKESDMEEWFVNKGQCVSGSKFSYKRRKQGSECLVRKVYEDLIWKEQICDKCTEADYECSFEFTRDPNGKCIPDLNLIKLSGKCKKNKQNLSLKPMTLIQGDKCKTPMKINDVAFKCSEDSSPQGSRNSITVTENKFNNKIVFYQYFDSFDDETIIFADNTGIAYISHDNGQNVQQIETNGEIIQEIVFNPYFNNSAFLFGRKGSLFITHDRGLTFTSTKLPEARQLGFPLDFDPKDKHSFIFYGGQNCENPSSQECHAVAYITRNGGRSFKELISDSIHCEFAGSQYKHPYSRDLIICQVRDKNSLKRSLISTTDEFQNDKHVLFENIIGYMSGDGYSVVAVHHGARELRAFVTQNGEEFAEAKLPQDLANLKQQTFTVLGSEMGSIFMHMNTNNDVDHFFGDLLKSNSNGTSFVTLQKDVNRNNQGLVDFEVVQNLDGIILINTVSNAENVKNNQEAKKLKTKITFNDGSDWEYIKAPVRDSHDKKYDCNINDMEHCSLNLHGSSEYFDNRDTYSSGSAVGMMFAVGNVGKYLLPKNQCSIFFTKDGGVTWKEIKKGAHHWEFGDHGSVIVVVSSDKATNYITYSLDAGDTWKDYVFTQDNILISDIVTVPHDSALRFLLITEASDVNGPYTKTFTIDFYNSFERQCIFDLANPNNNDFEYSRIIKSKDECLFGHKIEYLKKIHDECFIGNIPMSDFFRITEVCECTRKDFECDYNYYKAKDGTCKLVEGLSPQAPENICKLDQNLIEYSEPTGYRKIPLSICQGGLTLDVTMDRYPCPGKEEEFKEKYGVSGTYFFQIFFLFFIGFTIFGYIVYDRGIRRNGGFARFGEIRLGDEEQLVENNLVDKMINAVVRGGLTVISGIYAGAQLVKRFFTYLGSSVNNRFTSRRGPSYSSLIHDQLLDEADDLLAERNEDADDLASFIDHDSNFDIDISDNDDNLGRDTTDTTISDQGYTDHLEESRELPLSTDTNNQEDATLSSNNKDDTNGSGIN